MSIGMGQEPHLGWTLVVKKRFNLTLPTNARRRVASSQPLPNFRTSRPCDAAAWASACANLRWWVWNRAARRRVLMPATCSPERGLPGRSRLSLRAGAFSPSRALARNHAVAGALLGTATYCSPVSRFVADGALAPPSERHLALQLVDGANAEA